MYLVNQKVFYEKSKNITKKTYEFYKQISKLCIKSKSYLK